MARSADASSTSPRRRSRPSRPSGPGSSRSGSPGESGLGRGAVRDLAARYGIRPSRALGQTFLADPNLARAIVADAGIRPGDRVLEIGAGLGSLTVALADAGAEVVAVEFDRSLRPALREVVGARPNVRLEFGDALRLDLASLLDDGAWACVSNLPYSAAVPIVLRMLESLPQIRGYLLMVQREVGERLVARPGERAYGAASVRVAYWAHAALVRRVPPTVFWPQPQVESVLVRLAPRSPGRSVPERALFRLVEEGFAERRKTMRSALRRLGLSAREAADFLAARGLASDVRAERLGLGELAALAADLVARGVLGDSRR